MRAKSRQRSRDREVAFAAERNCRECGERIALRYQDKIYCSRKCSKRYDDRIKCARRRGRQLGSEAVDPMVVFERDNWRCQMCYKKTRRSLRGQKKPLAPELDHIIPLSRGGEHTYKNTQCLCYACNNAKGSKEIGQLRLIG